MTLLDSSGCLTEAGLAAVSRAAPGQSPPEVAAHLAGCARCQERVLSGGASRPAGKAVRPAAPSLQRALVLIALVVFAVFFFLWTLRRLVG